MFDAAFFVVFLIMPATAQDRCRALTFQKPRRGSRCIMEGPTTTLTEVPHHLCTHACMKQNCSLINYNHQKRHCQLGFDDCVRMEVDAEFIVTALQFPCLSVTVSPCIQWVPVANVDDDKDIVCSSSYRVGRLVLQEGILVGKFMSRNVEVWKDGSTYSTASKAEVLLLQSGCSTTWVSYTAGDPLPTGSVIGGFVGDPCKGTPIMRGGTGDRCGYYNTETQLGYVVTSSNAAKSTTEMDILVLIWFLYGWIETGAGHYWYSCCTIKNTDALWWYLQHHLQTAHVRDLMDSFARYSNINLNWDCDSIAHTEHICYCKRQDERLDLAELLQTDHKGIETFKKRLTHWLIL